MSTLITNRPLVIYDGQCKLCSRSIQFILRNESDKALVFTTTESSYARQILATHALQPYDDSIFYYSKSKGLLKESAAALAIVEHLKWPLKALLVLKLVPGFIRNTIYKWIARNRYGWFGKTKEKCLVPAPQDLERFID